MKVSFEGLGKVCGFRFSRELEYRKIAFRKPLKGEYYLSGAIPKAYRAPNDLLSPYWIVEPVK